MVTEEIQGISGERKLREKVVRLYAAISGYGGRPSQSQLTRVDVFRAEIEQANADFVTLTEKKLEALNSRLQEQELAPIVLLSEEEYRKREEL
jgi:hypothetical protein